MLTVQLAPAAKVLSQVVVREKSAAFAPTIPICPRCRVEMPSFVTVTICGLLPKLRLAGERLAAVTIPEEQAVRPTTNRTCRMRIETLFIIHDYSCFEFRALPSGKGVAFI
jgi:hypothetical protein